MIVPQAMRQTVLQPTFATAKPIRQEQFFTTPVGCAAIFFHSLRASLGRTISITVQLELSVHIVVPLNEVNRLGAERTADCLPITVIGFNTAVASVTSVVQTKRLVACVALERQKIPLPTQIHSTMCTYMAEFHNGIFDLNNRYSDERFCRIDRTAPQISPI